MPFNLKLGNRDLKITAGPMGMVLQYKEKQGVELQQPISTAEAMDLVAYLVQKLPTFSTSAYTEITDDVNEFKGRAVRDKKLKDLMDSMSALYFGRDLAYLTEDEANLVRRAATAEVAVAESEGKM